MPLEISSWVRNDNLINADLEEAAAGIKSIMSAIKSKCIGGQRISRLVDCANHRECGGQLYQRAPHGSSKHHAYNCPLGGTRLGCEGSEWRNCPATVNMKELQILTLASERIEKINVGTHTWDHSLEEASRVEAVQKALMRVHDSFFPHNLPPRRCQHLIGGSRAHAVLCNHPLVDQSLQCSFRHVQSVLVKVLDDLHLSKILASIFALRQVKPVVSPGGEGILDDADDMGLAPTEQIVQHAEEPTVRDEELARLQEEHDWTDRVVQIITDPTSSSIDPATLDTEQVFLFRFTRTPAEFRNSLEQSSQLANVREAMEAAGCAYILGPPHTGAKLFVWPEQYQTVMDAIQDLEKPLFSSHVVILESLMSCLEDIVAQIPRKANVHEKERHAFTSVTRITEAPTHMDIPEDADWRGVEGVLAEDRTFLCSVRALRTSVNQSTTEAHGGVNPRRFDTDSTSSARRKFRRLGL